MIEKNFVQGIQLPLVVRCFARYYAEFSLDFSNSTQRRFAGIVSAISSYTEKMVYVLTFVH